MLYKILLGQNSNFDLFYIHSVKSAIKFTIMVDISLQHGGTLANDSKKQEDAVQVERVLSPDEQKRDHMDFNRVDKELAKYTNDERVEICEADSKRLKKMIDKRVLTIMIITYFVQALDKGTMSFTSIMGITRDVHISATQVNCCPICRKQKDSGWNADVRSFLGSPPVSTLPSFVSSIQPIGSFSVFPLPNTSVSTSYSGV